MGGSSQRDPSIVAAIVRRIDETDPVALTNAAWFAARRGQLRAARSCAERAAVIAGTRSFAHRAGERLDAGAPDQLLLALPTPGVARARFAATPPLERGHSASASSMAEGRALLDAGRVTDSLAIFDLLARQEQADSAVLFHRGVALAKLRRYGDAIQDWHEIERTEPSGPLAAACRRLASSARRLADMFTGAG